jgi:hypothetical protein
VSVSSGQPTWRRAFDSVERKAGKPLEDAVASSRYVDLMLTTMKLQRAVGGALARQVQGRIGGLLHAINVPTRNDVRSLSRQLTVLTREVRSLAATTQELREQSGDKRPAKRASARAAEAEEAGDHA